VFDQGLRFSKPPKVDGSFSGSINGALLEALAT
jgi:hypothetical protein